MNKILEAFSSLGYEDVTIYPDGLIDATLDGVRHLDMKIVSFDPLEIEKPKSKKRLYKS